MECPDCDEGMIDGQLCARCGGHSEIDDELLVTKMVVIRGGRRVEVTTTYPPGVERR